MANSGDPDKTPQNMSDQGLYSTVCLQIRIKAKEKYHPTALNTEMVGIIDKNGKLHLA